MPRISEKYSCNWSGIFWTGFARNMQKFLPLTRDVLVGVIYCLSMAFHWGRGGGVPTSRLALQVTTSACFMEVEDGSREGAIDLLSFITCLLRGWCCWWCDSPCKFGIGWACNILLEKFQDTLLKCKLLFISLSSYFTNLEWGHKKRKDAKCSTDVRRSFCCLNFKLFLSLTCP